ncbi:MAG: putative manganese transporter, partial [Bacteroidales bacterium]|nr:putative manganese transporter [Bacteroidales bacterium]
NIFFMILIAALIGLIPESGPHMVFITLFAGGLIPFSVLFFSSLVQDGHTALPLLAESKKSFAKAKLINLTLGIVTGLILWSFGI